MPDQPSRPTPAANTGAEAGITARTPTEVEALLPALTQAVLAVPGVVRLEPTLSTSGPELLLHRRPTDGIRLVARARAADCDINIATTARCQARAVTHQVREAVTQLLRSHGYDATTVTVAVLTIEPRQAA